MSILKRKVAPEPEEGMSESVESVMEYIESNGLEFCEAARLVFEIMKKGTVQESDIKEIGEYMMVYIEEGETDDPVAMGWVGSDGLP